MESYEVAANFFCHPEKLFSIKIRMLFLLLLLLLLLLLVKATAQQRDKTRQAKSPDPACSTQRCCLRTMDEKERNHFEIIDVLLLPCTNLCLIYLISMT